MRATHHRRAGAIASAIALLVLAAAPPGSAAATADPAPPATGTTTDAAVTAEAGSAPLGFYDVVPGGGTRPIRNDVTGTLTGMVQFAQSHTVDPAGNTARNRPTLVAQRTALLLFTPSSPIASASVDVTVGGQTRGTLTMVSPAGIPDDDVVDDKGRPPVVYSTRAWSVELPWSWVTPGLALRFRDGQGRTGTLAAAGIEVAAPTELVVNGTQLGMLTDPPATSGHWMFNEPARAAADYFSTIPVSKLVVARYEPVRLDRVIVASGAIYTAPGTSATTGDVYSGDMRENVAKAQFSTGVNLAAFGITSRPMNQTQPGTFNQRVYHHAAGMYTNGRVVHGLSGGNGMATLYDSVGNEWSHELGHSYGLGHYPGTDNSQSGDARVINATHHSESGWGYIDHRNRMRSNLWNHRAFTPEGVDVNGTMFQQNFQGLYNYQRDAMSGGSVTSDLSRYTHHTAYSANRIQASLKTVVPDAAYPSGYRDWDPATGTWVDARARNSSFDAAKPRLVGVPVVTLLGGYNPANPAQTVLYPAVRSNYGNVFTHPAPDTGSTGPARQCWAEVTYTGGRVENISIGAGDGVQQVNVNLDAAARPSQARLLCRASGVTAQLGQTVAIRTDLPPMPPAVVIGQDTGYSALRQIEIAELDSILTARAGEESPVLGARGRLLLDSWRDELGGLSATARAVADRVLASWQDAAEIDAYVHEHRDALLAGSAAHRDELTTMMRQRGFAESSAQLLPAGATVTVDGGKCLRLDTSQAAPRVAVTAAPDGCADVPEQRWFRDARGAIHNSARPDLCLGAATPASALPCDTSWAAQEWVYEPDGHLRSVARPSQYLDLYRQTGLPGLWNRSTGTNQLWQGLVTSANPGMAVLEPDTLAVLFETQHRRAVSGLPLQRADNGWGPVEIDTSNGQAAAGDGRTLAVAGTTATVGLGVHADSIVEVGVPAACTRLTGSAGVDDETTQRGSVVMSIHGDGAELWRSSTLRGGAPAVLFDLDVSGVSILRLQVTTAGDGDAWDHADWLSPTLRC